MDQVHSGLLGHLYGFYRVGNTLTDPASPAVAIKRPDGTTYGDSVPTRLSAGIFRYDIIVPPSEPLGVWSIEWQGTLNGQAVASQDVFEVVPVDSVIYATIDQVKPDVVSYLYATFRAGNHLADPVNPQAKLLRPDGTEFVSGPPVRLQEGIFRFRFQVPGDEPFGTWTVEWSGTLVGRDVVSQNIFEVVDPDTPVAATVDQIQIGVLGHLYGYYRVGNTLTDPTSPAVAIKRPDGSAYGSAIPFRIAAGVFRYDIAIPSTEPLGLWGIDWSGTLNGQSVTAPDVFAVVAEPAAPGAYIFGTSLEGLRSYLPGLLISADSRPSEKQVIQFLNEIGSEVSLRIGDVATTLSSKPEILSRVLAFAKHATYLGAAATTQDATNQERSETGGEGYAATLWGRYTSALDKIEQIVADATGDETPGAGDDFDVASIESGPPMFSTYMPF